MNTLIDALFAAFLTTAVVLFALLAVILIILIGMMLGVVPA